MKYIVPSATLLCHRGKCGWGGGGGGGGEGSLRIIPGLPVLLQHSRILCYRGAEA